MLSALDKEQYWRTVEACLIEILGIDAAEAYQKVLKLRLDIAEGLDGEDLEIVYHNEAIKVAVDLAGYGLGQFDYLAHKEQYATIRNRYMPIGGNANIETLDSYIEMTKQVERTINRELQDTKATNPASLAKLSFAIGEIVVEYIESHERESKKP
jgi:hypothetical protein